MNEELIPVGEYRESFNKQLDISLPTGIIYRSSRLINHIQRRHPDFVGYIDKLPEILLNPDYIGKNPKEPDSMELVKVFSDNILVAIKLDDKNNYLYVASLYNISDGKLHNRIHSGRLKKLQQQD